MAGAAAGALQAPRSVGERDDGRGYNHGTPLDETLATGLDVQDRFVDAPAQQIELLRAKSCACRLDSLAPGREPAEG